MGSLVHLFALGRGGNDLKKKYCHLPAVIFHAKACKDAVLLKSARWQIWSNPKTRSAVTSLLRNGPPQNYKAKAASLQSVAAHDKKPTPRVIPHFTDFPFFWWIYRQLGLFPSQWEIFPGRGLVPSYPDWAQKGKGKEYEHGRLHCQNQGIHHCQDHQPAVKWGPIVWLC